jgi:hypothetical protein
MTGTIKRNFGQAGTNPDNAGRHVYACSGMFSASMEILGLVQTALTR